MSYIPGGGGGGGAPTGSSYVTVSADATLTAERRLVAGAGITLTDGGANSTMTIAASSTSSVASGTALLDFGGSPSAETDTASIVVADAGVGAASEVVAGLAYIATADHTADEIMISNVQVMVGSISAGVGFTVYGYCPDQTWGKYTVHWVRS